MKILFIFFVLAILTFSLATNTQENDSTCDLCEYVAFELEQYVNKSEPEIEKELVKLCQNLKPEYRSMCDTFVLLYGPQIIEYILKKEDPKTMCTQFGFCKAQKKPEPKNGETSCQLCQYIVSLAESYLSKNTTEEEIEKELRKVCASLPTVFTKECDSLVDEYIPYIIYYLKQKYPAEKICELLEICPKKVEETNDVKCFLCTKVVAWAEDYMEKNKTEQEIEEELRKLCEYAPFGEKDQCINIVNEYLPYIIHFLKQELPPKTICQYINLCPKEAEPQPENKLEKCPTCMIVIEALEKLIGEVVTRQEVEKALDKVCDKVSSSLKGTCIDIVHDFAMPIIDAVVQKATPSEICKLIKLCGPSQMRIV